MPLIYTVIDSTETIEYAFKNRIPLDDLLTFPCVKCEEPVFLTRKQHAAYERSRVDKMQEQPLVFVCVECAIAKRMIQRE